MTKLAFVTNTTSSVTEATFDGKSYLIAPVVMIREGVMNGMLYLAEEFGKFAESWQGRPVSVSHPQRAGQFVSANSPDIWANEVPGQLWNVIADGQSLKGEIWIDLEKAERIGEAAMTVVEGLRANQPTEVSTGLFADVEETAGVWANGAVYDGIARNIRPDHLALLPNEIGACSWEDGCGTPRVNQKGTKMPGELKTNELTLDDRASLVRRAFWAGVESAMPGDIAWGDWDVISVFEAQVIAKDWVKKHHVAFSYAIDDAGVVTIGTPTPVEVVYRAIEGGAEVVVANGDTAKQQGLFNRFRRWLGTDKAVTPVGVNEDEVNDILRTGAAPARSGSNSKQEADVKKCDLVANLVANKQCKFSKEALDKWSDADLETLHQSLTANEEQAAPVAAAVPDWQQAIDALAVKMDQVLGSITANADRERADLVSQISANSELGEADLRGLNNEQLRKLASSLQIHDYSGGAGVFRSNSQEEEYYEVPMPSAWKVAEEGK